MFNFEITDPHLLDEKTLVAFSKFLLSLAGHELARSDRTPINVTVNAPSNPPIPSLPTPSIVPPPPPLIPLTSSNETPEQEHVNQPVAIAETQTPYRIPFSEQPNAIPYPPSAAPGVELDVDNIPWDNRIHARTKSKTADGKWKLMRGLDNKVADTVMKELKKVMTIPKVAPAPIMQSPEDPMESAVIDFPALMTKITAAVAQGKISQLQIVEAVQSVGLPNLPVAATRPDLIPMIAAKIDLMI